MEDHQTTTSRECGARKPPLITDAHGRSVSYMRISVTDRCNLRCFYCAKEREEFLPHQDILRYEEILTLMSVGRDLGVSKFRLTGGEPFARKDFTSFMEEARKQFPDIDLNITSNGTLLTPEITRLAAAGIRRINISLDTLDRANYERITGRDELPRVQEAIEGCLEAGLGVKINAVAVKDLNGDELEAFLDLAAAKPVEVRFIEFMPMGRTTPWTPDQLLTADEILERLGKRAVLTPSAQALSHGPARVYDIKGGQGRIGLISPMSNHFCATCNRLRITSDGHLRTCLFSDREYALAPLLRHPRLGPDKVREVIARATGRKPLGHALLEARSESPSLAGSMFSIGG